MARAVVKPAKDRVAGWDLLRGLCALTVASYHLLYWLELVELPALATYGVYMFFVLSGASLAYNYPGEGFRRVGDIGRFLATRWLRLAPLYLLLCFVFLAMLAGRDGAWVDRIPERLAMNATFAFGLRDPVVWALLIGGWSLGIEFVYYLAFPGLAKIVAMRWLPFVLFAVLTALQWMWIQGTVGTKGLLDAAVTYHQVPAFAAYFVGGCVIGYARRISSGNWSMAAGVAAWSAMGALLGLLMPSRAGDELLGLDGALLFAACFGVVYASGKVRVPQRFESLAQWLGDITYGTYLLHPIVFFSLLWFVVPGITAWPLAQRVVALLVILVVVCVLAYAIERWFERPLRRAARIVLSPRQRDATSIAS